MVVFNSFVHALVDGVVQLYSKELNARYIFKDNKIILAEIYGLTSCRHKIGRLNVGDAYVIPFPVKNVHIYDDYIYLDVDHRINVITGQITKTHNPKMTYGSEFSREVELKALEIIPNNIKNFTISYICYDSDTKEVSFVALSLTGYEIHVINGNNQCGDMHNHGLCTDLLQIDDDEDEPTHTILVSKNQIENINSCGINATFIRFGYNCAFIDVENSEPSSEIYYSVGSDGKIDFDYQNRSYEKGTIYGEYIFHNIDSDMAEEYCCVDDDDLDLDSWDLAIITNDGRLIANLRSANLPITYREDLPNTEVVITAEIVLSSYVIKVCEFTESKINTPVICDGDIKPFSNHIYNVIYCNEFKVLYVYTFQSQSISITVQEIFEKIPACPVNFNSNFIFDIRECISHSLYPTVRVEGINLFVANMLKINLLTGERMFLTTPTNYYISRNITQNYCTPSDRYSITQVKDKAKIKDNYRNKEYEMRYFEHSDFHTAGNYLICQNRCVFSDEPEVNVLISTPSYLIFELV